MNVQEILTTLQSMGGDTIKNILLKHGAKEPCYGCKVEDLKKVIKSIKGRQDIAMELFGSGVYDAMYLAGLVADGAKMSLDQLNKWAELGYGGGISEYTVPWVAVENPAGFELGLKWIDSDTESIASSGWNTLGGWVAMVPDEKLDLLKIKELLQRIEADIHSSQNRVKYTMNGFVISVGSYVPALMDEAIRIAQNVGLISVNMNGTACKVPFAPDYILKVQSKGKLGIKRKTMKC